MAGTNSFCRNPGNLERGGSKHKKQGQRSRHQQRGDQRPGDPSSNSGLGGVFQVATVRVSASKSGSYFPGGEFFLGNALVRVGARPPLRNGFCNLGRFRRLRRTGPWRSGCVLSGPAGSVALPLTKPKIGKLGSGCVADNVSSLPMLWPPWPANCNNGKLSQLIPAQCSECSDFQPAHPTDPSTRRL